MRKLVGIVGGSSASREVEDLAEAVGFELGMRGVSIVCGGMGGVMKAACRGLRKAREQQPTANDAVSVGILPAADKLSANEFVDVAVPTGLGLARNALVALAADGVIVIDGESGTLSEIAMAWQFGKPIVALRTAGGWGERLAGQRIDDRRQDCVYGADSPEDAVSKLLGLLAS